MSRLSHHGGSLPVQHICPVFKYVTTLAGCDKFYVQAPDDCRFKTYGQYQSNIFMKYCHFTEGELMSLIHGQLFLTPCKSIYLGLAGFGKLDNAVFF